MIPSKIAENAEGKGRLLRLGQSSGQGAVLTQQNQSLIMLSLGVVC